MIRINQIKLPIDHTQGQLKNKIKKILKLIINSILGGLTIFLINLVGGIWGFHIGLNIFTSILVGVLGLPGAVCLVIVKLLI